MVKHDVVESAESSICKWNGSAPERDKGTFVFPEDLGLPVTGWSRGPGGMLTRWCEITPALAGRWLENNRNRNASKSTAYFYGDQMSHGQWHPTHQGVAFDREGLMRDGQHGMKGVVESGTTQEMLVTLNISDEAVMVVDIQNKRTEADALTMMGVEDVNNKTLAIIKRIIVGGRDRQSVRISRDDMIKLCLEWKEPIMFARPLWNSSKYCNAALSAVVARAWFTEDRAKLERFMEVFKSGESRCPEEDTIIRLRDWFLGIARSISNNSSARA